MTYVSDIYEAFEDKITDYDLAAYSYALQQELLSEYLKSACGHFGRICQQDLTIVETEQGDKVFDCDLTTQEINIITEWMLVAWLAPLRNDLDNLRNRINTAEFSSISPANMQNALEASYSASRARARSAMNEYSYIHGDFDKLKT